ncbi:hypothetical protein [Lacticaseibacillus yichunensis]|uniref:Uncharacterized protein n=1 Tax=Lacticaseibacillus yichunensis TaxID=2486015 RepID=A0ABW4CM99_9LACO|nr:hypothetical protein [Lacticaseibacillus yichunensis]
MAIEANVQPASGQLNASIYGERLAYMKNLKLQSDSVIENRDEGCGVCLDVEADAEPDYTIVSISTFATHKNVLIERLERGGDGR